MHKCITCPPWTCHLCALQIQQETHQQMKERTWTFFTTTSYTLTLINTLASCCRSSDFCTYYRQKIKLGSRRMIVIVHFVSSVEFALVFMFSLHLQYHKLMFHSTTSMHFTHKMKRLYTIYPWLCLKMSHQIHSFEVRTQWQTYTNAYPGFSHTHSLGVVSFWALAY